MFEKEKQKRPFCISFKGNEKEDIMCLEVFVQGRLEHVLEMVPLEDHVQTNNNSGGRSSGPCLTLFIHSFLLK